MSRSTGVAYFQRFQTDLHALRTDTQFRGVLAKRRVLLLLLLLLLLQQQLLLLLVAVDKMLRMYWLQIRRETHVTEGLSRGEVGRDG